MTVTLWKSYAAGETDYIAQMNNNAEIIENALNQIFSQLTGQAQGSQAVPAGLQQIFDRPGLIGIGSYDFNVGIGSALTVQPGAYWSGSQFLAKATPTTLSLAGQPAGTYYIYLDAAGNPVISQTGGVLTIRQFTWDGSATTSNKALYTGVAILLSGADYAAMLTSSARNRSYTRVADRLSDLEAQPPQTLAPADSVSIDWRNGRLAQITLNRAATTFSFTGGTDGQTYILALLQDGTGGRSVAFGPQVRQGSISLNLSGPNQTDYLGFIYRAAVDKYDLVSMSKGY